MSAAPEVLLPTSADEAVSLFGDGAGVTVVGGGTIVIPELTLRPAQAVEGAAARPAPGSRESHATARPSRSARRRRSPSFRASRAPLGPCAANIADLEIRAQAHRRRQPLRRGRPGRAARRPPGRAARARRDRPLRGRRRRSTTEPLEDFLPHRATRLRPRRLVRGAGGRRVRRARPAAHPRLHGARGLGRAARRTARSASRRPESPARRRAPPVGRGGRRQIPRPPARRR